MADESRMHRLRKGDKVSYQDTSTWPPVDMEGKVAGFANAELSYLEVDFGDGDVRTLTEDEVRRVG
jgi:hypothetical protein